MPLPLPTLQPGQEGLWPGEGWRGLEGSDRGTGNEGAARMTAGDRMTQSPSCCRCIKGGARGGTMSLGNRSPSCSGFEAEPLCWLQHSANRWQQDWQSQENPSCGGQRAAERERSSQTRGSGGRGCGEETLYSLPQARPPPGADPLCPPAPQVSTCPHAATSAHPGQGTQESSRTLRAHGLTRSPPQRLT